MSLHAAEEAGLGAIPSLPYVKRALLENVLRHCDGHTVTAEHARSLVAGESAACVPFFPERILMQDASGIPLLADIITLQERAVERGLGATSISPRLRMDLVVDHALEVDVAGDLGAASLNLAHEYNRHGDRYRFLRWAESRFPTLRVVPPGIGICHQLNLESLANVVSVGTDNQRRLARLDSVVGTDSHTTMINALSVTGWGVGGIEATAAVLGQPLMIPVPEVVGVKLTGKPNPCVLASDIALTLVSLLRTHGVVQRIVEFHGPALTRLSVPDRATIANMAPEYGATMAYFPPDERTIDYLVATGRPESTVSLVRAYLGAQGLLHAPGRASARYDETLELDLATVEPTISGPFRPDQKLSVNQLAQDYPEASVPAENETRLRHGDVVIAAITSCTNTSNPRAMAAAGVLARNAAARGLRSAPWTKTSLTLGSSWTAEMLQSRGLQTALDELGFHVAGFGCGTCMGNSGPLDPDVTAEIRERNLSVAAVLSGNRNFPGRIHPDVALAYLASPPFVVAMAIAGRTTVDLTKEPLAVNVAGVPVYLDEIWPSEREIDDVVAAAECCPSGRGRLLPLTTTEWANLPHPSTTSFDWDDEAGSIRRPPFADPKLTRPDRDGDIHGARPLLLLGNGVTTDHISPVARIDVNSAAGQWLTSRGVAPNALGSYSSRRLNHDVMVRGGFANPKLLNRLTPECQGGWTAVMPHGTILPIYEAATTYAKLGVPTVVVAGYSYGVGSARDWAAKVTRLLGVQAVIARSFERIHRTNLVAMGVLPIECPDLSPFDLDGSEIFDITGLVGELGVHAAVRVTVSGATTGVRQLDARVRIDTAAEADWLRVGGLIAHMLVAPGSGPT
ncbi:aconitate hydratase AcnA [Mycolicibacterium septicum DSM 44393]|uniref:2-methylisocitrate dehydratase n=1 Tax=Mycolicibacterium septicum DSM 44393 TaxID=1341646 RepID=A0A7X6RVL3_9MYCO|nr:aconitate hydratase AcnA [Mycolicibacterium septicum DSM 44393]